MNDRELWQCIYASFEYHRKASDPNAQAAMDRVAAKCLGLGSQKSFNPSNCHVREELLSAASLRHLKRFHLRANPHHLDGPIVVLLYEGVKVVIEGNNRVNAWIARRSEGPFSAIIVQPHV